MFVTFGTPKRLDDLGITSPQIRDLKDKYEILILDDEPFVKADSLRSHDFRIKEFGGDIKSVNQVSNYPIIVCDIKGVGKAFGSIHEGAHVISEIRKSYPDKYLLAYTGSTYDPTYNDKLSYADKVAAKDISIEHWISHLEEGLRNVGDPKMRWLRLRASLLTRGMDLFDVFKLEQAFIGSIKGRNTSIFTESANQLKVTDETKDLIVKFTATALAQLIQNILVN